MPLLTLSLLATCIYSSAAGGVAAQEYCANTAGFSNRVYRVLDSIMEGLLWPATIACNFNQALLDRPGGIVTLRVAPQAPAPAASPMSAPEDTKPVLIAP